MGRLIIGATAIVAGLLAALGVVVRRRGGHREDVLAIDPAPPLGGHARGPQERDAVPSVEADFGPVGDPPAAGANSADSAAATTRKPRAPRKTSTTKPGPKSKARTTSTTKGDAAGQAAKSAVRPKRQSRVGTSPAVTDVAESIEPAAGDGYVADGS
jgi:hypothetical protein